MILDLEAIRRRADDASPGPWKCYNGWGPPVGAPHYERAIHRIGPADHNGGVRGYADTFPLHDGDCYAYVADAEFIAHAREDVPALLAEIERLRAVIADAVIVVDKLTDVAVMQQIRTGQTSYEAAVRMYGQAAMDAGKRFDEFRKELETTP